MGQRVYFLLHLSSTLLITISRSLIKCPIACQTVCLTPTLLIKSAGCRRLGGLYSQTYNDFKHIRTRSRWVKIAHKVNICIITVTQKFEKVWKDLCRVFQLIADLLVSFCFCAAGVWGSRWNKLRKTLCPCWGAQGPALKNTDTLIRFDYDIVKCW